MCVCLFLFAYVFHYVCMCNSVRASINYSIIRVKFHSKVCRCVHIIYIDDPCQSNPCLNGGTCTMDGKDFACSCIDGYTGRKCASKMCKTMFFFNVY